MTKNYKSIRIESDSFNKLKDCKKEYLNHHPEMRGVFITNTKIIEEIIEYYLYGDKIKLFRK